MNNSLKKNLKIIVPILFISASFLGIMRDIVLVLLQPLLHHASGFILGLRKGLYISVQLLFTLAYIGHIFQSRLLSTTRGLCQGDHFTCCTQFFIKNDHSLLFKSYTPLYSGPTIYPRLHSFDPSIRMGAPFNSK